MRVFFLYVFLMAILGLVVFEAPAMATSTNTLHYKHGSFIAVVQTNAGSRDAYDVFVQQINKHMHMVMAMALSGRGEKTELYIRCAHTGTYTLFGNNEQILGGACDINEDVISIVSAKLGAGKLASVLTFSGYAVRVEKVNTAADPRERLRYWADKLEGDYESCLRFFGDVSIYPLWLSESEPGEILYGLFCSEQEAKSGMQEVSSNNGKPVAVPVTINVREFGKYLH
ncbi:MAG: hypothetical protein GWN86_30510 [Desulfobacterales bacterium]|nr:hypothetical protein [Desulfobacterales bacterium]